MEVGQKKAGSVANPAVCIGGAFQYLVRYTHLPTVIGGGNPETNDICAERFHDLLGTDDIAQGFGHFQSLGVDGEAMGKHTFIRSAAIDRHCGEQRRLKPTAVLIRSLKI